MRFYLISFILFISACAELPPLPRDHLYVLDNKINKTLVYDTPAKKDDNFIYRETIPLLDVFKRSPTNSLYCITPSYFIDLKNYATDLEKFIERKCSK